MTQLKTYRNEELTSPDITTWAYHAPTGLLTSKTYADAKAVSYTYSADGKLATRTWARFGVPPSGGLLTSYSYNAATGELTGIDYSDSTPDVVFTYNRLGQQNTVADVVGTRTFAYNAALQLSGEVIDGSSGGLYSKTLSRSYAMSGVLGRYTGMNIGTEYTVAHCYDAYGRPGSMTAGTDTFTFAYLANSDLLSSITYPNDIASARSYESHRDLITSVENSVLSDPSVVISRYDYTNDAIGRRTAMGKTGTAFSLADLISYGYNDRSEVTSAVSANLATYDYGYEFDPIGNRITSRRGAEARSYTSNNLNQYTAIDNPAATPSYDDGNMTSLPVSTGTWACTWDAENRLVAMEKATQRLEFKYDYASRRVRKQVYTGSPGNWSLITDHLFVYDGFLQIEKLNGAAENALLTTRIWSNAEGFDKLIAETHIGTTSNVTYYALGDANKNITCYLTNAGAIGGHFEFSPFGQITRASGSSPDDFDFRFSSEFFEQETGLVYYNFRYYSPELGRWASRDPVGERGGYNIFIMLDNNSNNHIDYIGLGKVSYVIKLFRITCDGTKEFVKVISNKEARELLQEYTKKQAKADGGKGLIIEYGSKTQARKASKIKGKKRVFDPSPNKGHFHPDRKSGVHVEWMLECFLIDLTMVGDAKDLGELGVKATDEIFDALEGWAGATALGEHAQAITEAANEELDSARQKEQDKKELAETLDDRGRDMLDRMVDNIEKARGGR
jgi:RHS repeat-associated protein